jgi:uncharacterized repeat protein (TIGR01451 family)
MNASRRVSLLFSAILVVLFGAQRATAQCVSLTTLAAASTQNFDTLSNTAGSTTNNLTITGWFLTESGGGARDNEQYAVDTGASTTGDMYSYGAAAATERALGQLRSGTLIPLFGACYTNNTGASLTSLDINYFGEQWRIGNTVAARDDRMDFQYSTNATSLATGTWLDVNALDFTNPIKTNATATNLNGNLAANRTNLVSTIGSLAIPNGATFWIRWNDIDATGADDGLAIDDFSLTPQGAVINNPIVPTCATPLTTNTGTATSEGVSATDSDGTVTSATITGITPVNPGTITLTGFTPAGGVGGTANATLSVSAATPANTYSVTIQWANNDGVPQTANCVVSVVVNPPPTITFIHDVQGNGAATPIPGSSVTVEGVVIGDFQGANQLSGFFLQEEDADADADPATSEGIFIFCITCPTAVAEGQKVQVTGTVSEFNNMTEITASTAGSLVITNAGNNLAQVTPATIDLPIVGVVNDFYEAREGMRVTFVDSLVVSEYFELPRFGHIELFEGGRPLQFTETNAPSVAGNAAYLAALDRRRVILDDDNNNQNGNLTPFQPEGQQFVYHPRANGGFSVGTQGTDFFRGGDLVNGLTGVLHWSFPGVAPDTWRIRPTSATPATFTVNNPRPATPPVVGGAIKAAGLNLLNYFTTIDTTASNNTGPCGPSGGQDCRGADSVAELNRQRDRASRVLCGINADVYGLMELENTTATDTINDLLGAVNTLCGGTHPYAFVNTGSTLGTDAIRVAEIYRTGILSPVGSPQTDPNPVHNRPPTAQTFDVVDATNPAFGQRFTVVANHFKSKGCGGASGGDLDSGDGQGCFAATRTAQANALINWINVTVIPAAGDPDVLLLGDFNSYAQETPTTTITSNGYTDVSTALLGAAGAYSYLFDAQLGHLDYAFASASLMPQITGVGPWHINADEADLFDYNDEVKDTGEAAFEEKPDGSALVPPRVVFQPGSVYRAADHDPVTLGLFSSADLSITKSDSPDPVIAGNNLTYTITVTNIGPDAAASASWSDNLTDSTFVSLSSVAGWSCTDPGAGNTGTINCTNPSFAVGSAVFTLTTAVSASAAGPLSNTATVTSATTDSNPGDNSDTEPTTVSASADLSVTKSDSPDPVNAGGDITYTITVNNAGPSFASTVELTDTVPANTTFVSLSNPGGWTCSAPAPGATGNISCTIASLGLGNAVFTLVVNVDPSTASGASISNAATVTSTTSDPNAGNETGNSATTVATSADLSVTKSDSPDPVDAGANLTYTITVNNAGPSNASTVTLTDILPAETLFVSLASPAGWLCTTPGAFMNGTVTCNAASVGLGDHVFTLVVNVLAATPSGTVINNSATVMTNATADPNNGNETGSASTTVATSVNMVVTKSDSPDPVNAGSNITYAITVQNAGPSNAAGVTLSDTLPAGTTFVSFTSPLGWTCSTPAVGATGTVSCSKDSDQVAGTSTPFTLVVKVDPTVATGTVISNSITVASTTPESTPGNETATATTTVATSADLSVTKVDTPDPVLAGNQITYTITVTNAGPSNASTVTFTDTLPAGTTFAFLAAPGAWVCPVPATGAPIVCTHASLPVGTSVFTIKTIVDPATAAGTVLTNNVTVAATTSDPNPGNEAASAATTVATSANLSVTKTDSPDPVNAGGNLTYTITVNNAGPSNASTVSLSDTLPAGTTFVSLANPGWSCTTPAVGATGTVSCSNASLGVGSAVFTLVVNVNPSTAAGTVLSNSATVTSTTSDPTPGNETGTATTTVAASADLSVTKVDTPDPVTAGNNIAYTITVNNAGPSNASTVTLSDTVPANTTFVSLSAPGGWSCTTPAVGATGTISCSNPNLAPGNAVFTLVVAVGAGVADGTVITNTVTVASPTDTNNANDSGTATTTVGSGSADLSISKTDSPDPVTPGNNLTYQITLTNSGPSNATSASFSDTLPAGTTFVSLSTTGPWTCTTPAVGATGTVSCSNPSFGVTVDFFTLVVNVDPSVAAGTVLSNTATVSSATTESNPGNESSTATTTVGAASADLLISKTDSPDPVTPGSNIAYQLTLTNSGPSSAASATLSDTLPAGTTFVSLSTTGPWTCTTPAVGATGTVSCTNPSYGGVDFFTLVVNVNPSVAAGTILTNTATLGSATADPNGANNSSTATTTVGAGSADLLISKTDSPDPVAPGSNIAYQLTLSNNGPSNAASATFSDTLPAGTTFVSLSTTGPWTCTTPAVGATGTVSCTNPSYGGVDFFTLVVNVDPSVAAGTILTNTATLGSATADPNGANNSDTATTTVGPGSADLLLTKTDSPDPVAPGSNLTYQITITNSGPSNATTASFSDTLPAGTTFVSLSTTGSWICTTPAVGATGTVSCSNASFGVTVDFFTIVVNVDSSVTTGTILTNTGTVSSATADPNGANNSSTATTTVGNGSADLSVTKTDSPDPVAPGGNITYTITVNNAGPSSATSVALADTVPAGTTFVSLSSPGGWTCSTPAVGATGAINCSIPTMAIGSNVFTLVVATDSGLAAATIISNTATVSSATTEANPGDESATATTTVGTGSADLSLTKTDSPDPVSPGTNITYTITLNNAGPATATTVSLSDTTPAGTTFVSLASSVGWNCTTPAVGGTGAITCTNASMVTGNALFTLIVNVDGSATDGTIITNVATVTATTIDSTPANNTATATTTVSTADADLSITKTDSPDPVTAGTNLTYTLTVNNAGPDAASTVAVSDTLPTETTFVSISTPAGWNCTTPAVGATGAISCTNPGMTVGSAVFTVVVNVSSTTPGGTVLSNTATVTSATADPAAGNESDTETTTVISPATVSGTKTTSGPRTPGSTLTYTIVLTNAGPARQSDNPGNEFTDILPPQLTLLSATATTGTAVANVGTNTVTWNGSIAAGATVTITIQALIESDIAPGTTVTNQGTISYDADGNGTNEASAGTDDPGQPGGGNPTGFVVALPTGIDDVPALDGIGLAALAALLAALGVVVMRRS